MQSFGYPDEQFGWGVQLAAPQVSAKSNQRTTIVFAHLTLPALRAAGAAALPTIPAVGITAGSIAVTGIAKLAGAGAETIAGRG